MIGVEYKQVELDYCGNCQGVWFDAGELELLLEKAGVDGASSFMSTLMRQPEAATSEKRRKCPICRRRMKKASIAGESHVLIDGCERGDGIWFDGGEVDHLVKFLAQGTGVKPREGEVFSFIKEVFKG